MGLALVNCNGHYTFGAQVQCERVVMPSRLSSDLVSVVSGQLAFISRKGSEGHMGHATIRFNEIRMDLSEQKGIAIHVVGFPRRRNSLVSHAQPCGASSWRSIS